MRHGIIVCGMNGAGKSTLGRALADALNYRFIDVEDLYFPKTDPNYLYSSPRTDDEFTALLKAETCAHEKFVLAAVRCDYDADVTERFDFAVLMDVPKALRMTRVRSRSYKKFGERMMPGGDLYETEERFFAQIESRPESYVEDRIGRLSCPIIRVDGTKPIAENVALICEELSIRFNT